MRRLERVDELPVSLACAIEPLREEEARDRPGRDEVGLLGQELAAEREIGQHGRAKLSERDIGVVVGVEPGGVDLLVHRAQEVVAQPVDFLGAGEIRLEQHQAATDHHGLSDHVSERRAVRVRQRGVG